MNSFKHHRGRLKGRGPKVADDFFHAPMRAVEAIGAVHRRKERAQKGGAQHPTKRVSKALNEWGSRHNF